MIIKKLAPLCKGAKKLCLYDTPGGPQWAGDGNAVYELSGLPALGESGLCAVMDIPPDKAADMDIRRQDWPRDYCLDGAAQEIPLDFDTGAYIAHEGIKLMPCTDGSALAFIQPKYLGPLTDAESLTLALRHTPGGQAYIVAKAGLFVVGVIMPATLDKNTLVWLGETYGLACEAGRDKDGE